jgi:Rps23 Pro-64 3,4-dihydroxylase Tpa1-like proline 4-hydroxylase
LRSLNKHTDSVMTRRIAFTLHFTHDWLLSYGGLLVMLSDRDWNAAKRILKPTSGTFSFFDVSSEHFHWPHMVTEVAQDIGGRERIALTGAMLVSLSYAFLFVHAII